MSSLNLMPFAILWALLALVVLGLIMIRRRVTAGEDDSLHVMEDAVRAIPQQQAIAQKLEVIDKWGKMLTVVTVVFGVLLGLLWAYQTWVNANSAALH